MGGGVAVAPILEHPSEQLVGRLLGSELRLVVLGRRQKEARLELEQRRDQDEELGRRIEVELAGPLEVLEIGDHDLAERNLGQAHLLPEHDRHQEVEGAREHVEVELELRSSHRS